MKKRMTVWSSSVLSLAILGACGSENAAGPASGGGGSGGSGGSGGNSSMVFGCEPSCGAGEICSVTAVCIPVGTCVADGDCGEANICDPATTTCVPGGSCGAVEIEADAVPPNLLMVLDRSCSMTDQVNGVKKWDIAVQAIKTMTTAFTGQARFGLSLFPDLVAPACDQDTPIPVPPGAGHEQQIAAFLEGALSNDSPYYPNNPCVTNIDTAMKQAAAAPELTDPDRTSYVVLITDGKQSACNLGGGDSGTTQIITDLTAAGVPTFAVGFGAGIDPAQMDAFANAGGVPASGATAYYRADDQATLDAALSAIATKTLSCSFTLQEAPEDPEKIYVFFDNVESIARDPSHTDGWDYDAETNRLTFYGPACEELKTGVADVDIVFGCNEPTPN